MNENVKNELKSFIYQVMPLFWISTFGPGVILVTGHIQERHGGLPIRHDHWWFSEPFGWFLIVVSLVSMIYCIYKAKK